MNDEQPWAGHRLTEPLRADYSSLLGWSLFGAVALTLLIILLRVKTNGSRRAASEQATSVTRDPPDCSWPHAIATIGIWLWTIALWLNGALYAGRLLFDQMSSAEAILVSSQLEISLRLWVWGLMPLGLVWLATRPPVSVAIVWSPPASNPGTANNQP
ncbi:MAG: hypothetical protein IT458_20065 [Planctomycetes bacterium]|nr:hypothetical protein [Planctomycetota bacterium]